MTDTTADAMPTGTGATPSRGEGRSFLEVVGAITLAVLAMWVVYTVGKTTFYDGAFNDGFEAGRASIQRACANPDRSLAVARGCPL